MLWVWRRDEETTRGRNMNRLTFLLGYMETFFYWKETGGGMAVKSYNIFTDMVTIRHSLRGYVTCIRRYKRAEFLEKINNPKWEMTR